MITRRRFGSTARMARMTECFVAISPRCATSLLPRFRRRWICRHVSSMSKMSFSHCAMYTLSSASSASVGRTGVLGRLGRAAGQVLSPDKGTILEEQRHERSIRIAHQHVLSVNDGLGCAEEHKALRSLPGVVPSPLARVDVQDP